MRQFESDERDKGFNRQVKKIVFQLWVAPIVLVALLCLYLAFFTGGNGAYGHEAGGVVISVILFIVILFIWDTASKEERRRLVK